MFKILTKRKYNKLKKELSMWKESAIKSGTSVIILSDRVQELVIENAKLKADISRKTQPRDAKGRFTKNAV